MNYSKMVDSYVKDALSGKTVVDTDTKEACERHNAMKLKGRGKVYNPKEVERIGWFLRNIGVDVTPYHCFMAATVFGWKERI
jgi:hypothetical protein